MEIVLYEAWMKPQIAKLFNLQYGIKEEDFAKLIGDFYDHPYQQNRCIRIVAKEGDAIIGFQSFFYWPYIFNGKLTHSYQSGNSLVHPDHRGKGIFQKLLSYLDSYPEKFNIDFLMGFPVEQSKNNFIKNKWDNLLDLKWYVRIINPLGALLNIRRADSHFEKEPSFVSFPFKDKFRLTQDKDFIEWRKEYSSTGNYLFHRYKDNTGEVCFHLKTNKRNKWFNELIIGDIQYSSDNEKLIRKAFSSLHRAAVRCLCITSVTIALNEAGDQIILSALKKKGYIGTNKGIYFIVKSYTENKLIRNKEKWILYRSDIDTW